MTKLKTWVLWLIVAITFGVAVGLICLALNLDDTTIVLIFIIIDFLIMTFALNMAISKTFRYKPKPKKYPNKAYANYDPDKLMSNLKAKGFKANKVRYGQIYMKIDGDVAYKVIIIDNASEYLTEDDNKGKNTNVNTDLRKCSKFIGSEVFLDYNDPNDRILKSITDFSFQGDQIYYEAFYFDKETNTLHEPNIIEVTDKFKDDVLKLKQEYLLLKESE